jgi:hypothetical protein
MYGTEQRCMQSFGGERGMKSLLGSRHKWEDNIKMNLQAGEWGSTDWVDMAEDRDRTQSVVNVVKNHRVP